MSIFHNLDYAALYEQFIREKQYLANVSPATVAGYRWAWKAFAPALDGTKTAEKPEILARIAELRESGLSPVTVNTYLRSLNTFFSWLHREGRLPTPMKISRLKEEKKLIATFSAEQIERLISFRARTLTERRLHALCCLILDTGIRINEALSLERRDVDYGSLLLNIRGKGGKHRSVPMSIQMCKALFRFAKEQEPQCGEQLFFVNGGERIHQRNALRDFKLLCRRLGIQGPRCSFHTLRHTFSKCYVRNGGDVFRLQRILGHSSLTMTRRYVELDTADLQAVHHRLSAFAVSARR
jgi:integrase/recombinase XerD